MIKAMGLAYVLLGVGWLGAKLYVIEAYPCPTEDAAAFHACMAAQDRTLWIINGAFVALFIVIAAVAFRASQGEDEI